MKKNLTLCSAVFLFLSLTFSAQAPSNPTPGTPGGVGGTTPGVQSIPVDMYVYALAIVAILLVVFFAKKYNTHKI